MRLRPIINPNGIDTITPTPKPIAIRRNDAMMLIRDSLSPRIEGTALIASIAVGKLSVSRVSAAACQSPSSPIQASHGAKRERTARADIMVATRLHSYHRSSARYRRRISGSGNPAAAPTGGADEADQD